MLLHIWCIIIWKEIFIFHLSFTVCLSVCFFARMKFMPPLSFYHTVSVVVNIVNCLCFHMFLSIAITYWYINSIIIDFCDRWLNYVGTYVLRAKNQYKYRFRSKGTARRNLFVTHFFSTVAYIILKYALDGLLKVNQRLIYFA